MEHPVNLKQNGHAGDAGDAGHEHGSEHTHLGHRDSAAMDPALKDPVCGMPVNTESPHQAEHAGRPYWFCSADCRTKFLGQPQKYLSPVAAPARPDVADAAVVAGVANVAGVAGVATTIYTCPMHAEIRQHHPGDCPKCGMTLEPVMPSLNDEANPELADFTRRFWWTLPLTVVVTVLAMFGHRLGWMDMDTQSWLELVLTVPIVLWAGWPFFVRGAQSVVNRSPNMWTLIGLGTGAAFVYSVVATVAPHVFPDSFVSMGRVAV